MSDAIAGCFFVGCAFVGIAFMVLGILTTIQHLSITVRWY